MNECEVMMKLRAHPNIVRVSEHFVEDGKLHIIMEYCSHGSLQQAMARHERAGDKFEEEEVFDWFIQVRRKTLHTAAHTNKRS